MSGLADHPGTRTRARAPEIVVRPPARRAEVLVLSWSISRDGAIAGGLTKTERGPAVRLEVSISAPREDADASVEARIIDGGSTSPIAMEAAGATWIEDTVADVWHLDIADLLKLTVRRTADRTEALYARTSLLARAGVSGGRYEFDGVTVQQR